LLNARRDAVSIAPCRERLRAKGKDAQLTEFPNVSMSFRSDHAHPGFAPQLQTCTLEAVL